MTFAYSGKSFGFVLLLDGIFMHSRLYYPTEVLDLFYQIERVSCLRLVWTLSTCSMRLGLQMIPKSCTNHPQIIYESYQKAPQSDLREPQKRPRAPRPRAPKMAPRSSPSALRFLKSHSKCAKNAPRLQFGSHYGAPGPPKSTPKGEKNNIEKQHILFTDFVIIWAWF